MMLTLREACMLALCSLLFAHCGVQELLRQDKGQRETVSAPPDEARLLERSSVTTREPLPSEKRFDSIFANMPPSPKERDYNSILKQIQDLCEAHPGSDAAYRAIFAVQRWVDKGLIPATAATQFTSFKERFNPAKERLAALEDEAEKAAQSSDHESLRRVIEELRGIAAAHPDTVSEFLAMGNIGPAYDGIGEARLALDSANEFLRKFPPMETDFPSTDSYMFLNLCLHAKLISNTESTELGINAYREIAQMYKGRPALAVPTLFQAGELAAKSKRYPTAIEIFDELATNYDKQDDSRVVLSRFRIAEVLAEKGDVDQGIEAADTLVSEFAGDPHWEMQASRLRSYLITGGAESPTEFARKEPPPVAATRNWLWVILAVNVAVVAIVVLMAYRKKRSHQSGEC